MRRSFRFLLVTFLILVASITFSACGGFDQDALHMNHVDKNPDTYGKGNYLYSTVVFSGTDLGEETVLSIKDLEKMTEDETLGYQNEYSFLTRGSIFSTNQMSGIKLYELLLSLGMKKSLPDGTNVTVVSYDGYDNIMTLGDLRSKQYGRYKEMGLGEADESGLPVLLAFGSDGKPLVGPTGSQDAGYKMTEKDGYIEKAANASGPVLLTIGQTSSTDYNAPKNAKWVREVIIGKPSNYTKHQGKEGKRAALTVSLYDRDKKNRKISAKKYTYTDIQASAGKLPARNYYGEKDFFEGAELWVFLAKTAGVNSQEGVATFTYRDGAKDTVDLTYLRNLNGNFEDYSTDKDGLTITAVKPALGYGQNGRASDIYALLPAKDGVHKDSTAKVCTNIDVYMGASTFKSANPNKNSKLSVIGKGVKQQTDYTVEKLEKMPDLQATDKNGHNGVSLIGLLRHSGLTVDAEKVTLKNQSGEKTFTIEELQDKKNEKLLATRTKGTPLAEEGPILLTGIDSLAGITEINVDIRAGQWTHDAGVYSKYQNKELIVSGSEVNKKIYTLNDLEKIDPVRDSFGASAGVNGYQGAILRELIDDNLKDGVKKPSKITVVGKDGYETDINVNDVYEGIESKYQNGQHRDVILAYSIDGLPLVPGKGSEGYKDMNEFGPIRLVVENQLSKWVKGVSEIRIGE